MIMSRLNQNEKTLLTPFFLKRVLPIAVLFCVFLFFSNGLSTAFVLFICIPIEVFVIIVILELNVSKKYYTSLKLNLLGYPLIFIIYIVASRFFDLLQFDILLIFFTSSFLRLTLAYNLRKKAGVTNDVFITSAQVPIQQAGNYLLFKLDQVMIASNMVQTSFLRFSLPGDYLFYSKFSEIFSGIATSLGPILAKFKEPGSEAISVKPLLRNNRFLIINLLALIIRIIISLVLLRKIDTLHLLMLIPFSIVTILIVPVNMINYEFYRKNDLRSVNFNNMAAFFVTAVFLGINYFVRSAFLFAWIVPLQLIVFILFSWHRKSLKSYS